MALVCVVVALTVVVLALARSKVKLYWNPLTGEFGIEIEPGPKFPPGPAQDELPPGEAGT
jgi:hypothetical protein